jgi:hypothetical protein
MIMKDKSGKNCKEAAVSFLRYYRNHENLWIKSPALHSNTKQESSAFGVSPTDFSTLSTVNCGSIFRRLNTANTKAYNGTQP